MTTYEQLAADLTAAGIPSTVSAARRLSERDFYGGEVTILESLVLAQWAARPWKPERSRHPGEPVTEPVKDLNPIDGIISP